jgi:hypothetical protein
MRRMSHTHKLRFPFWQSLPNPWRCCSQYVRKQWPTLFTMWRLFRATCRQDNSINFINSVILMRPAKTMLQKTVLLFKTKKKVSFLLTFMGHTTPVPMWSLWNRQVTDAHLMWLVNRTKNAPKDIGARSLTAQALWLGFLSHLSN